MALFSLNVCVSISLFRFDFETPAIEASKCTMTRAIWSSRLRVSNFRNTEQPRVVIARLHVQEISRSSQRRTAYMDSSIFVLCITRYNHGSEFVILQDRSRHLRALSGSWSYVLITSWPCSSKTQIKKWLRLVTTQWLADIGKSTSAFFVENCAAIFRSCLRKE